MVLVIFLMFLLLQENTKTSHPAPGQEWRCQEDLRPDLRGNPLLTEGLPGERDSRRCHLHRLPPDGVPCCQDPRAHQERRQGQQEVAHYPQAPPAHHQVIRYSAYDNCRWIYCNLLPAITFHLFRNDEELNKLLSGVTTAQGGVLPNIQAVLLPKKSAKAGGKAD